MGKDSKTSRRFRVQSQVVLDGIMKLEFHRCFQHWKRLRFRYEQDNTETKTKVSLKPL